MDIIKILTRTMYLAFLIILVLVGLSLKSVLTQQILSGYAIIIGQPGDGIQVGENETVIEPRIVKTQDETNKNIKCWRKAGLNNEDVLIAGNLISLMDCPETKKAKVNINKKNNCLNIALENNLDTEVCNLKKEQPTIRIDIPTQGTSPEIPVKRDYGNAIFFFSILFIVMYLWRQMEIYEIKKPRHSKGYPLAYQEEEPEVRIIRAPPVFGKKEPITSDQEVSRIHARLIKEKELSSVKYRTIKTEDINYYTIEFNTLSKEINELIKNQELKKAKEKFSRLFSLYLSLYEIVDDKTKKELLEVVQYIHHQILLLTKSRNIYGLIQKAYEEAESHKIKEPAELEKIPEKLKSYGVQDISKELDIIRDLLQKSKTEEAIKRYNKLFKK